jgi:hypothetical protein
VRSEPPPHPDLLDWLAGEFIRGGWRVKNLHRLIMNSAVYLQSSLEADASTLTSSTAESQSLLPSAGASDPENRLLARMNRRRHDFETQRDALLTVAGKLDQKPGGPPDELSTARRTLYTFVNRMDVPPVMTTFDFPSPSTSCPQRAHTTVAPQALYLMNNEVAADCAAALSCRSDVVALKSAADRIDRLYKILFGRPATAFDLRRAEEYLGTSPDEKKWQHYTHALLLANEFVFVD